MKLCRYLLLISLLALSISGVVVADETTVYETSAMQLSTSSSDFEVSVSSYNISLDGEITIGFMVEYNKLTGGEYAVISVDGSEEKVEIAEYITKKLSAKQICSKVSICFYDANDNLVYSTNASVADYCMSDIENDSDSRHLTSALLNYGIAAQKYFKYNVDNTLDYTFMDASNVELSNEYQYFESGSLSGISYYGTTLLLKSVTGLRHYFAVSDNITDYTFKVDDMIVNPVYKDGLYYIDVSNIPATRFDNSYIVTISNNEATYELVYSVNDAIYKVLSNTQFYDNDFIYLMKSLYQYGVYASEYAKLKAETEKDSETEKPDDGNNNSSSGGSPYEGEFDFFY